MGEDRLNGPAKPPQIGTWVCARTEQFLKVIGPWVREGAIPQQDPWIPGRKQRLNRKLVASIQWFRDGGLRP